jgi:hypothetical protein
MNHPSEWRGILTMKKVTRGVIGPQPFWTTGESCRWKMCNMMHTRKMLQSGSMEQQTSIVI